MTVIFASKLLSSPSTFTVKVAVSVLSATISPLSTLSSTVGTGDSVGVAVIAKVSDVKPLYDALKRYSPPVVVVKVLPSSTELSLRQMIITSSVVALPSTFTVNVATSLPSATIVVLSAVSSTLPSVCSVISQATKPVASERRANMLNSFFIIYSCL